jgi:CelD/BcsL family acetyltransferase involved in cellulose biosynthesis
MLAESLVHARGRTLHRALVPPSSFAVVDPIRDPRWAALVQEASAGCAFHHPAWLGLLERVYGYPVMACAVLDGHGNFEAGLPMALVGGRVNSARLVALPFSDVVVPLARDARASQWRRLSIALHQFQQQNALSIELRGEFPGEAQRETDSTFRHHLLSLTPGYEAVARGMKPQIARGERRARREGLRVEFRTDGGALAEFFGLHVRTRKRQGVPTQPRRFIMAFEDLFAQGLGFVVLVRDGRVPAAAAVFLSANGTLIYKYGASDPRLLAKRPNNLLFMDTIRCGSTSGGRTQIRTACVRSSGRSGQWRRRLPTARWQAWTSGLDGTATASRGRSSGAHPHSWAGSPVSCSIGTSRHDSPPVRPP